MRDLWGLTLHQSGSPVRNRIHPRNSNHGTLRRDASMGSNIRKWRRDGRALVESHPNHEGWRNHEYWRPMTKCLFLLFIFIIQNGGFHCDTFICISCFLTYLPPFFSLPLVPTRVSASCCDLPEWFANTNYLHGRQSFYIRIAEGHKLSQLTSTLITIVLF